MSARRFLWSPRTVPLHCICCAICLEGHRLDVRASVPAVTEDGAPPLHLSRILCGVCGGTSSRCPRVGSCGHRGRRPSIAFVAYSVWRDIVSMSARRFLRSPRTAPLHCICCVFCVEGHRLDVRASDLHPAAHLRLAWRLKLPDCLHA